MNCARSVDRIAVLHMEASQTSEPGLNCLRRSSGSPILAPHALLLNPVFNPQSRHAFEFRLIVGDQNEFAGKRVSGNP